MLNILVVDDDPLVRRLFQTGWPESADRLSFASSYAQASMLVTSGRISAIDCVIVDMSLPDGDGLMIVKEVRDVSEIPVIVISGGGTSDTRSTLIEHGADDYVMKPFTMRELSARLRRQIKVRHPQAGTSTIASPFRVGKVLCDPTAMHLSLEGDRVDLTGAEARLLAELDRSRNRPAGKELLYKKAFFKPMSPDDKTLDVYISRARKKVAVLDNGSADHIKTLRGIGYVLVDERVRVARGLTSRNSSAP